LKENIDKHQINLTALLNNLATYNYTKNNESEEMNEQSKTVQNRYANHCSNNDNANYNTEQEFSSFSFNFEKLNSINTSTNNEVNLLTQQEITCSLQHIKAKLQQSLITIFKHITINLWRSKTAEGLDKIKNEVC